MSTLQELLARLAAMPRLAQVTIIAAAAAALGFSVRSTAQPQPMLRFHWSPPPLERTVVTAEGDTVTLRSSPAVAYAVQESTAARAYWREVAVVGDTIYETPYPYGVGPYKLRVIGVDSQGRRGPHSKPSAAWQDDGPPAEAGQPVATLVIR